MRPPLDAVHPTQDDGVVASLSEAIGGPVGERAGRGGPFSVLGVLLAMTALTFALGLVSKTACAVDGWPTDGQTRFTHLCVSEVPDAYTGTGLVELAWPWSGDEQTRARYGVTEEPAAVGLWSYAAARATHLLSGSPDLEDRYRQSAGTLAATDEVGTERDVFMALNVIGFALLAMLATAALAQVHRRRPWDAAGFAAAPVLALSGVVAWDLLPVAAVACALWAWSRGRPAIAGVLVGVGAAAGPWVALLLVAFLLTTVRERRTAVVLPAAVSALAAWAVLNAPAFLSGRAQWERFWQAATERGADEGSVWRIVADTAGLSPDVGLRVSLALIGLWVAAVAALVLLAPGRARVSQVGLLLVAGVAVLSLDHEPQHALWLLPLAALARPRWRDLLIWQAGEVLYFALSWWYEGGLLDPGGDGDSGFYWLSILVRVACTLWLVAMVVRDLWWPELDVVEPQVTSMRSNDVVV